MEKLVKKEGTPAAIRQGLLVDSGIKFNLCRIFLLIPDKLNMPPQRVIKDFAQEMNMLVKQSRQGIITVPDMSIAEAIKKVDEPN